MRDSVRIEPAVSLPLAVVRRHVSASELSRVVTEACGLVWKAVKDAGIRDAGRQVAIYRNAQDGRLDVEIGVEVSTPFPGSGEVVASVLPAGEAATLTHFGPYGRLGAAHQAILDWCTAHDRSLEGTRWELYGHWLPEWNDDPSRIRTDVFYLLKS